MLEIFGWDDEDFRCVPCLKAKRLAESRGLPFKFIPLAKKNVSETHIDNRKELESRLSLIGIELTTLPQVFLDGVNVGGFDDFKSAIHTFEKSRWESA